MKWVRAAGQIGLAVKNAQRLRQIVSVFARHGFADFVERMNLGKYLPEKWTQSSSSESLAPTAERLRKAFEELGPTFVKLGQLLSTRSDLFSEATIDELKKLQDNVQPLPYSVIQSTVEAELKCPVLSRFSNFNEQPLASASIAQVHEATLLDGSIVVVKVQRPGLEKLIEQDVSLLAFLAQLLEKYVPETRAIQPSVIVDEFFRTLDFETDFRIEASNIERMAHNLKDNTDVVLPKVYREVSTQKILVLEKLIGIRVHDLAAIDQAGIDRNKIVDIGARVFFKTVFVDGMFHGDLHGGNLFILPGNRIGIIDFGIIGRLSQKSRSQLATMVLSLVEEDFETLCFTYAELGAASHSIDMEGFQREVRNTLAPYLGLKLDEVNIGKVLIAATRIATKYQVQVPGDWMIVFKAIITIEGMGRTLDPKFDLLSLGKDLVGDLAKNQYSPQALAKEGVLFAQEMGSLLQTMPRQIRWMLRKFNSNDFAFEIKSTQIDELKQQLDQNTRRTTLAILSIGFFAVSTLALQSDRGPRIQDVAILPILYFGLGAFLILKLFFRSFK
jgi:ubiquinone biosynthesis protein